MTRGSIVATLASLPPKGLVIICSTLSILLLLLLLPTMISPSSIDVIGKHTIFTTSNHRAWAFAPTTAVGNNTSFPAQSNTATTPSPTDNQAPISDNKEDVTAIQDIPVQLTLSARDADSNDTLEFTIVSFPLNGALSGFDASSTANTTITYTPNQGFVGKDSFTFKVTDNEGAVSNTATVSITVMQQSNNNSIPTVPASQSIVTDEGKSTPIALTASDADNDHNGTLTFSIVGQPSHGSLSGTAPNLVYTPQQNYSGNDSFTYKVNDGEADSSNVGTVTITVRAVNEPPIASAGADQIVNSGETSGSTSSTDNGQGIGGFNQYGDPVIGVALQYPSDWRIRSDPKSIGFVSQFQNDLDKFPEMVSVWIEEFDSNDLQKDIVKEIDFVRSQHPDLEIIEADTNSTLADNPAYKFVFAYTEGVEFGNCRDVCDLKGIHIGTVAGGVEYHLAYWGEASKYDIYFPTIQWMIDSLEITTLTEEPNQ